MKKIIYNGESKVIKKICNTLNEIIEGGVGASSPLYYDSEGHICIDYDKLEEESNGE